MRKSSRRRIKLWARHAARRAFTRPRLGRKKVICHFGFRKAGSTTVQAMLRANSSLIQDHVGLVLRTTDPSTDDLRATGVAYTKGHDRTSLLDLKAAASDLAEAIGRLPQEAVILSDENVIGNKVMLDGRDIFAMAAEILPVLEDEWRGFDVSFVFYTRERQAWLRSCYSQAVKWHRSTEIYEAYLAANGSCRSWQQGEAALTASVRSPVHFVRMEDDLAGGGMLGRTLLDMAGVPAEVQSKMEPAAAQNQSPTVQQLELMREINSLKLGWDTSHAVARIIERRRDLFADAAPKLHSRAS